MRDLCETCLLSWASASSALAVCSLVTERRSPRTASSASLYATKTRSYVAITSVEPGWSAAAWEIRKTSNPILRCGETRVCHIWAKWGTSVLVGRLLPRLALCLLGAAGERCDAHLEEELLRAQQRHPRLVALDGYALAEDFDVCEVLCLLRPRLLQDALELGPEDIGGSLGVCEALDTLLLLLPLRQLTHPPQVVRTEPNRRVHLGRHLPVQVRLLREAHAAELSADLDGAFEGGERGRPVLPLQLIVPRHEGRVRLSLQRRPLVATDRRECREISRPLDRLGEPMEEMVAWAWFVIGGVVTLQLHRQAPRPLSAEEREHQVAALAHTRRLELLLHVAILRPVGALERAAEAVEAAGAVRAVPTVVPVTQPVLALRRLDEVEQVEGDLGEGREESSLGLGVLGGLGVGGALLGVRVGVAVARPTDRIIHIHRGRGFLGSHSPCRERAVGSHAGRNQTPPHIDTTPKACYTYEAQRRLPSLVLRRSPGWMGAPMAWGELEMVGHSHVRTLQPILNLPPNKPSLISASEVRVGRAKGCWLRLSQKLTWVSNEHVSIGRHPTRHAYVRDTSSNGTWLNGVRLPKGEMRALRCCDDITCCASAETPEGETELRISFRFHCYGDAGRECSNHSRAAAADDEEETGVVSRRLRMPARPANPKPAKGAKQGRPNGGGVSEGLEPMGACGPLPGAEEPPPKRLRRNALRLAAALGGPPHTRAASMAAAARSAGGSFSSEEGAIPERSLSEVRAHEQLLCTLIAEAEAETRAARREAEHASLTQVSHKSRTRLAHVSHTPHTNPAHVSHKSHTSLTQVSHTSLFTLHSSQTSHSPTPSANPRRDS